MYGFDNLRKVECACMLWHQMTMFKLGGQLGQGFNKNELLLHRKTQSRNLKQLVDTVLKYSPNSTWIIRIKHMEGEEIFGS
jgi:hypothetical protein